MEEKKGFKTCTTCSKEWGKIIDFIKDHKLDINGYQASFDESVEGLFMFTHTTDQCGTTLASKTGNFRFLYDGPDYKINNAYSETCEGHCQRVNDIEPCTQECSMRWARDILQILREHGESLNGKNK